MTWTPYLTLFFVILLAHESDHSLIKKLSEEMITNELNRLLLIHKNPNGKLVLRKFPLVVCISDLKLQPLPYYNENSFIVGKTSCSFVLCFNCDYITRRWRCEHSVRIFSTVIWDYAQKCTNERSRFLHIFYIRVFSFVSQDVPAKADFTKVFFFQVEWQSNHLIWATQHMFRWSCWSDSPKSVYYRWPP